VTPLHLAQVPFPNRAWLLNPRTWDRLTEATLQHIELAVLSVALGMVLAAPLALLAVRRRRLYTPLLGAAGVIYTIPSLAMFLLLAVVLGSGFSRTTAVVGLALYSLLILFRNTVAGLDSVPADVREAGEAMGYTRNQLLLRVELPLALPVIIAGLRIALVSAIGLVTITALIGQPNLGSFFITGFQRQDATILLVAVACVVVIAVVGDLLLVALQRLALPWARGGAS
jgi:osmoprotectant transport system permease protein